MSKTPQYQCGGIYHVYNHANGRENMFIEAENYRYFLQKYAEKLNKVVTTLAYCLMPNHFHLLIQVKTMEEIKVFIQEKKEKDKFLKLPVFSKEEEMVHFIVKRQFHNFLGGYVKAFNKFHDRKGGLLRQNTKRKIVNNKEYIKNAIRYLHLNPVFHGFTMLPSEWQHSSYNAYINKCDTKLPKENVLKFFGGLNNFIAYHKEKLNAVIVPEFEI